GEVETFTGTQVTHSADGTTTAFVRREGAENVITVIRPAGRADVVRRSEPVANPALSRDGTRLVYQAMPREDWELYIVDADGTGERRLTREIQHDLLLWYLDDGRVLAVMGEARHRRSFLYDPDTGRRTRLFHNNTIRTVAPEYQWVLSPDGSR